MDGAAGAPVSSELAGRPAGLATALVYRASGYGCARAACTCTVFAAYQWVGVFDRRRAAPIPIVAQCAVSRPAWSLEAASSAGSSHPQRRPLEMHRLSALPAEARSRPWRRAGRSRCRSASGRRRKPRRVSYANGTRTWTAPLQSRQSIRWGTTSRTSGSRRWHIREPLGEHWRAYTTHVRQGIAPVLGAVRWQKLTSRDV